MKELFRHLFAEEHISSFGFLPLKYANIINPRLMPLDVKTAVIIAVPYDLCQEYTDGVSAYAHIRDYHRFFAELYDRLLVKLHNLYPNESFYGFADHSPIAEKDAAAKVGLGVLGCHSLLIHPEFGSYVFLGSLLTSMEIECDVQKVRFCNACGKCKNACPVHAITKNGIDSSLCLSALSQKKKLSPEELAVLKDNRIAWGCDICQAACPQNAKRTPTTVPYFLKHRHGSFNAQEVEHMQKDEFLQYAFSWRGKNRILQNLQNLEAD